MYSRFKKRENLFILTQIIVWKLNWYQSWIMILQFVALKFFLGVHLHKGGGPSIFSIEKPPNFFNEIVKFTSQIAWKQIFRTFITLVLELLGVGITASARY